MRFDVLLTDDAVRDIEEVYDYIFEHDDSTKADYVLGRLETAINGLATNPKRGACPKELLALGIREYRQTFFKPYRIIYRIAGRQVYIYLIADGRRDMQTLLARRLFGT